ncbi:TIGR02757 family protein [Flavimarina sp. Hel_I_48]|uniref:TIGR02757 family protein n=1 Tax=Flavimarina sp. Hel_I_48 TaxID=1392488 RepID=UPI0004DEFE13|nr:TIGR02757 family protein [Flavimarina sp. Hel_I_48]
MNKKDLKDFLDEKAALYEQPKFIGTDPIQIPHQFSGKEDREIAGFLTATIAWGNRKSIINNATQMMQLMEQEPYNFVMHHQEQDLKSLNHFVHRTFNGTDFGTFIRGLRHIYNNYAGMEAIFKSNAETKSLQTAIHTFKKHFFEIEHLKRSQKHVSDPLKKSAAKRINMFLRWMIRSDGKNVDFGLWDSLSPAQLSCPLDVHSGRVARQLGLLKRKQNDATAVAELDKALRKLDPQDPVKYDFALFGMSAFEKNSF